MSHVDISQLSIALFATQAGATALVALVLFALHHVYRRAFLLHWGVSWMALAFFCVGTALASQFAHLPADHPARFLAGALTLTAGYAQVTWLVSGTWRLVTGRRVGRALRPLLFALPVLLGCASMIGALALDETGSLFTRFALHGLVAGLAFLGAACGVARVAWREPALSRALVAGLFVLAGLTELADFAAQVSRADGSFLDSLASVLVPHFLALFLQLLLLSSLLLWFFEDERKDLARTARALSKSEQQRQRSEHMEAVGRLAGGVAHDFNNLLTAIIGHAELLLSRAGEGHPDREDLVPITHAAGRATELVRELLTFSRRQPLRPQRIVLDRLLGDIRKTLDRLVGESIELRFELGAPTAVLDADPAQIELAVINLASNARDAIAGEGKILLRTSVALVEPGGDALLAPGRYLRLDAIDSGCGIRPDALERIFEPFYTTKPGKGTGLGLASVYGIVKQSGGEIRVESTPGRGATFRIWLPIVEELCEAAGAVEPRDELVPALFTGGGSESILLVEDDVQVRLLAQRQLTRAGYRVTPAESLDEALACLRRSPGAFQLMLSDVVMPGRSLRDGLDDLRLEHPALRILLMSGYSEASISQRGIALARGHFLTKPFTARVLLDAVRGALDAPIPQRVPSASA